MVFTIFGFLVVKIQNKISALFYEITLKSREKLPLNLFKELVLALR
jgi:hypothetical protein